MKNKLEQLLNSLIEKGWKPRGENVNKVIKTGIDEFGDGYVLFDGELNGYKQRGCNMTELVSKSSGLWQFVCDREHRFIDKKNYEGVRLDKRLKNPYVDYDGVNTEYEWITGLDYKYRLIESALLDEDKLEEFLLSNINVDGE